MKQAEVPCWVRLLCKLTSKGPMVYACAYVPIAYKDQIKAHGFDGRQRLLLTKDSKVLTSITRHKLLEKICTDLKDDMGWSVRVLTAFDISSGMLAPAAYNLNAQAHDATISLIKETLALGVDLQEVIIIEVLI